MKRSPKYVQSKTELKDEESAEWKQLSEIDCTEDNDGLLLWLTRYLLSRNHPRAVVPHTGVKKQGEVLVCSEDDALPNVFGELITQGFLGCPVLDSKKKYVHFVDMLDITKAVLTAFGVFRAGREATDAEFTAFARTEAFNKASVKKLIEDFKKEDEKPPALFKSYSLLSAMEIMARECQRRIPYTDANGQIKGILTNSMVISLIDQNLQKTGGIRNKSVGSMLGGIRENVLCCKPGDSALNAFQKMAEHNVLGLAVCNDDGVLVDHLSTRDLRILGSRLEKFMRLYCSVTTFKEICRTAFKRQTPPRPIYLQKSDSFEDLVRAMDDGNIHRVYVITMNDKGEPIPTHVISQRDVLRYLIWQSGLDPTCVEDLKAAKI